ncbi:hypothetical protein T12_2814 [Trichinella patagoniensis]|uniref:Uncharacterized protein n=1 Tax=Trichinella patagoniensis TaxID=990121 RepID=A0A0V1A8K1_9BILA|nr:hypothetical protein T12_2814 [Trichinella patagoniensis]
MITVLAVRSIYCLTVMFWHVKRVKQIIPSTKYFVGNRPQFLSVRCGICVWTAPLQFITKPIFNEPTIYQY